MQNNQVTSQMNLDLLRKDKEKATALLLKILADHDPSRITVTRTGGGNWLQPQRSKTTSQNKS